MKSQSMSMVIGLSLASVLFFPGTIFAQDTANVRAEVFREANATFQKAESENVPVLSPKKFAAARKYYLEAQNDFDKGDKLKKVQEKLGRAMAGIQEASDAAEMSRVVMKDTIIVRSQALQSSVPIKDSKEFQQAEKKFLEAAGECEKDQVKNARKKALEAEKAYRKATINVLEKVTWESAKKHLDTMKGDIPKETFNRVKKTLDEVKKLIKSREKAAFEVAALTNQITGQIDKAFTDAGLPGVS